MLNDPGGGVSRGDVARCLCDRQVRNYEEPVNTRALQRLAGGLHATRQQLLLSSELRSLW